MKSAAIALLFIFGAALLAQQGCVQENDEAAPRAVFNVDDFGASPGSSVNCRASIMRAIEAAKACGKPAELRFGEGIYRVSSDEPSKDKHLLAHCLNVNGARDLAIRGVPGKTSLLVTNPENGLFWLRDCKRVSIDGFVVDYDPLPFTQGRVESIDLESGSYAARIDEGFDELDKPHFQKKLSTILVYDPQSCPDLVPGEVVLPSGSAVRIGERLWRLKSEGGWMKKYDPNSKGPDPLLDPHVRKGAKITFSARAGGNVATMSGCSDVSLSRLRVCAAPGFMVLSMMGRGLSISDCVIAPPDGSSRFLSTCADGLHIKNLRGSLTIERCRIEKCGDDSINFHSTGLFVEKALSPTELLLDGKGWSGLVGPGDLLQIIGQKAGFRAEATAVAVTPLEGGRKYRVLLDREVEGVVAGSDREGDLVFNVSCAPDPFVVKGCSLSAQSCIIARGRNGLIEGNSFESTTIKQALCMTHSGFPWFEGPVPGRVAVRDNVFRGQRVSQIVLSGAGAMRDVSVERNLFEDIASPAIQVNGAKGVVIKDNRIDSPLSLPRYSRPYSYVSIDNSEGIAIEGLSVNDPSPKMKSVIFVGKGVKRGEDGFSSKGLRVEISPSSLAMDDERERRE